MFQYIVLEIRRTLRDGFFLIFGTGMPVMMYLLFTNIGGGEGVDGWKTTAMVGMAAYGALGSAMSIGTGVASDKSLGWLQQLRVTPLSSSQAVVGRAISGSVTVLPTILTVLLAGGCSTEYAWRPGSGPHSSCSCGSAPCPSPCSESATATG